MLTNLTKSLSINAKSNTADGKTIAYMSANIATPGGISFNNSIQDLDLYSENEEMVNADFAEFQAQASEISKQYKEVK